MRRAIARRNGSGLAPPELDDARQHALLVTPDPMLIPMVSFTASRPWRHTSFTTTVAERLRVGQLSAGDRGINDSGRCEDDPEELVVDGERAAPRAYHERPVVRGLRLVVMPA